MITSAPHNFYRKADVCFDCSFGNVLFTIAGIIGVATKKGYSYGFYDWPNQEFFVNPLPKVDETVFTRFQNPINFKGFDIGFLGFNIPDNSFVNGYFGSEKYFKHCEELIRHYFIMKDLWEPYEDCILMHYRSYVGIDGVAHLDHEYYLEALKKFPSKRVVVVTDNIEVAKRAIKEDFEYVSNTPIMDFYLLTKTNYLVMGNSTFSWWAAWLSKAETVAPLKWYDGYFKDCPTVDLYCDNWTLL